MFFVGYGATGELGDGGMDTAAETFVGRDNDEQFALGWAIHFGVLEHLYKGCYETASPDTKRD